MKTFGIIIVCFIAIILLLQFWPKNDDSILEYGVKAGIDVATSVATESVKEVLQVKRDNDTVTARVRQNELESALKAEQEKSLILQAENKRLNSIESDLRRQVDEINERREILWEYVNRIPESDTSAKTCVPRIAAIYNWLRIETDRDNSNSPVL